MKKRISNEYESAISRLEIYSRIFNDYSNWQSIHSLSSYLQIPDDILRKDIIFLNRDNPVIQLLPIEIDESESFDIDNFLEALKDNPNYSYNPDIDTLDDFINDNFASLVSDKLIDNLELQAITNYYQPNAMPSYVIPVNDAEYNAFMAFKNGNTTDDLDEPVQIWNKNYLGTLNHSYIEKTSIIDNAINDYLYISFDYDRPDNKVYLNPMLLCYDYTECQYAVVGFYKGNLKAFFLSRMYNIKIVSDDEASGLFDDTYNTEWLKVKEKVWGFEFDKCLSSDGTLNKPIKVKVLFKNHSNVHKKVRRDLKYRGQYKLTEKKEGKESVLIYEDDIYGVDSFLNWIYSYGSSAIIKSPDALIAKAVESLKKRKTLLENVHISTDA